MSQNGRQDETLPKNVQELYRESSEQVETSGAHIREQSTVLAKLTGKLEAQSLAAEAAEKLLRWVGLARCLLYTSASGSTSNHLDSSSKEGAHLKLLTWLCTSYYTQ